MIGQETVALLHVFSGIHLGARIELTEGSWLVGSDDECDLILKGLASRHALLTIRSEEENVSVSLEPKDGRIFYENAAVEEEISPEAGKPWYLGETCFAWNYRDAVQEAIIPTQATPDQQRAEGTDEKNRTEEDHSEEVSPKEEESPSEEKVDKPSPPLAMETPKRTPLLQRLRRPLPLLLLAFLLCALSLTLSSGISSSEYPTVVNDLLEQNAFKGFAVSPRFPGVEVRGAVAKASDLERLENVLQDVSFPVYLEVAVDDDLLHAVHNSLRIQGFSPVVVVDRTKDNPKLLISAFMRDGLIESAAFAQLEKDVPPPPVKELRIIHEQDVDPLLRTQLLNSGFVNVKPVYLPGRITLTNIAPGDNQAALERIERSLSRHFGVPLFGENVLELLSANSENLSANSENSKGPLFSSLPNGEHGARLTVPGSRGGRIANTQGAEEEDLLQQLRYTGIFIAPLSFITTEDGMRLFQGSVLPNGSVIERITSSTVTLRRGDKLITYRLRGKHE